MSNVPASNVRYGLAALAALHLQEKAADVFFTFDSGERLPAHKLLLVACSEVFDTMFYGSVPETGDVKIVDVSADVFKEFLKLFYFTEVQLTTEIVGGVIYLGEKYNVAGCMDVCEQFMRANISMDNALPIFETAILYDLRYLKHMSGMKIAHHAEVVFKSPYFLGSSKEVLQSILQIEYFSYPEVDVFKVYMAWIKHVSGQDELTREIVQEYFGNLYEFRFRSMTMDEFSNLMQLYPSVFFYHEIHEITRMIGSSKFQPVHFNGINRYERPEITCDRYLNSDFGTPIFIGNIDITEFTASEDMLLLKLMFSRLCRNQGYFEANVPVTMTISIVPDREENGPLQEEIIYNDQFELKANSFTVKKLRKPVFIRASSKHKIQLDLQQSGHNLWTWEKNVQFGDGVNIRFHRDKGLIQMLKFKQLSRTRSQT